ncbi:ABC transporter ATP-binding protein [Nocardioidaceae bacterium SCSIO 66511]|nr:ABC transporter ATP-binding protein [Nocardioidaceae bacterium SCSIO 66511]
MSTDLNDPLLSVNDLRVTYGRAEHEAVTVDDLSFAVAPGETLGIVGESGSGKSMTSLAVLGLLPRGARVTGSVRFHGEELLDRSDDSMRTLRGNEIAMVFQDALTALNPVHTVGDQLLEAIRAHRTDLSRAAMHDRAIETLELVGIPAARERMGQYPHEFSGGMRQRAMIAMSIINEPALLIADEPTTALDVTVQAQVLDVFRRIRERTGTAIILITHDLGVVAGVADRVLVMYAGRQVEVADVDSLFYETAHPYTAGLLASLPGLETTNPRQRLFQIDGQPPDSTVLPPGCRFAPRCPHTVDACTGSPPAEAMLSDGHSVYCVRADELQNGLLR